MKRRLINMSLALYWYEIMSILWSKIQFNELFCILKRSISSLGQWTQSVAAPTDRSLDLITLYLDNPAQATTGQRDTTPRVFLSDWLIFNPPIKIHLINRSWTCGLCFGCCPQRGRSLWLSSRIPSKIQHCIFKRHFWLLNNYLFSLPTHWEEVLDLVWVPSWSQKFVKNIRTELWIRFLSFHRQK